MKMRKTKGQLCQWCTEESRALIGDINLFLSDDSDVKLGEINLMIAEHAYRRKGIGASALMMFLDYAFKQLDVKRFVAKILESNKSSVAFFTSMGFTERERSAVFKEVTMVNDTWYPSIPEGYSTHNIESECTSDQLEMLEII